MNEPAAENQTFLQRHWKWILPIVFLGPILIMLLTCASFVWSVKRLNTSRPAYEMTVQKVMGDAQVREALGEPLVLDEMILGDVRIDGDAGSATLSFGVAGPNAQGLVESAATRSAGFWSLDRVTVTLYDKGEPGEVIAIVGDPQASGPDEDASSHE